jgi:hypothetical protein
MAIETFLERIATLPVALVSLLVLIGSTYVVGKLNPSEEITKSIEVPYVSIGMTFGYEPAALYGMLDAMDAHHNGAELKAKFRRFFYYDLIYPWFYALAGAVLIAYLQRGYNSTHTVSMHYLWVLPIVAGLLDYAENLSMLRVLSIYEGKPLTTLVGFSRLMTMLKLVFIYAYLFAIISLTIQNLITWFKGRSVQHSVG